MSGATVTVRALATLAAHTPPGGVLALEPGMTVAGVAHRLGLALATVGTVLVNGRAAGAGTSLSPGDTVSFVPPITGG